MMKTIFNLAKTKRNAFLFGLLFVFALTFSVQMNAQTRRKTTTGTAKKKVVAKPRQSAGNNEKDWSALVKVTQIDEIALAKLLKREGADAKPLLVNFWATWCDPCREEFPDLVKLDAEYKGKIDLITISLDDLAEIKRDVPKFLAEMKAEMPSYLLKSSDEEAAIASVSKSWQGGLPFTILFNGQGESVYFTQGKFKNELLRAEIDETIAKSANNISDNNNGQKMTALWQKAEESETPYQKGTTDAQKDILSEKLQIIRYGEGTSENSKLKKYLKAEYKVEMLKLGCKVSSKLVEYIKGYNEISEAEIKKRYGLSILERVI